MYSFLFVIINKIKYINNETQEEYNKENIMGSVKSEVFK